MDNELIVKLFYFRFDVSNLPSESEIKGGTLDFNPKLGHLLSKYENLKTISLELHDRHTLQCEGLKRDSPVQEIANDICKDLQDMTGENEEVEAEKLRLRMRGLRPSVQDGEIEEGLPEPKAPGPKRQPKAKKGLAPP